MNLRQRLYDRLRSLLRPEAGPVSDVAPPASPGSRFHGGLPAGLKMVEARKLNEYATFVIHGDRPGRYTDASAQPFQSVAGDSQHIASPVECNRSAMFAINSRVAQRLSFHIIDMDPADAAALSQIQCEFLVERQVKLAAHLDELIDAHDTDLEVRVAKLEEMVDTLIRGRTKAQDAVRRLGGTILTADPRVITPSVLIQPGEVHEVVLTWFRALPLRRPIVVRRYLRGMEKVEVV